MLIKRKYFRLLLILMPFLGVSGAHAAQGDILRMELKCGNVDIETWPDKAPKHVAQITKLVNEKFYDGIIFHRVIPGFMAQTGDPRGTGTGGSHLPDIPAEFNTVSFKRGIVGMARSRNPNSANSQFFIMFDHKPHLDGQYTAWGRVIAGMECVDQINKGVPAPKPDKILKFSVLKKPVE